MKVTIEVDGITSTVEDNGVVLWVDALQLFEQALRGCGYHFKWTTEQLLNQLGVEDD